MTRALAFTLICFAAVLTASGCANPADDKPVATVNEPKPITESPAPAPAPAPSAALVVAASTPAVTPTAAPVGALVIAPDTSKIDFEGSKVTGSHKGGFKTFNGTAELAPDGSTLSKIAIEVAMDSTWTDNEKLTGHLKAADFFDVAKFPKSTFETTEIKAGGDKGATHTITGNLTLHGVTKSISFPATVVVKDGGATLSSEFVIKRKDFGIAYAGMTNDMIRDEVVIRLDVKAPKKA